MKWTSIWYDGKSYVSNGDGRLYDPNTKLAVLIHKGNGVYGPIRQAAPMPVEDLTPPFTGKNKDK